MTWILLWLAVSFIAALIVGRFIAAGRGGDD
jgi:uncharacterized protein YneF (UPF0154 family)